MVLKQNKDWLTKHSNPVESWFRPPRERQPSAKSERLKGFSPCCSSLFSQAELPKQRQRQSHGCLSTLTGWLLGVIKAREWRPERPLCPKPLTPLMRQMCRPGTPSRGKLVLIKQREGFLGGNEQAHASLPWQQTGWEEIIPCHQAPFPLRTPELASATCGHLDLWLTLGRPASDFGSLSPHHQFF